MNGAEYKLIQDLELRVQQLEEAVRKLVESRLITSGRAEAEVAKQVQDATKNKKAI